MERLTQWIGEGEDRKAIARQDRRDIGDKDCVNRLAAYEDTGLTPEEIKDFVQRWEQAVELAGLCKQAGVDHLQELVKAEKDGRLVVLPCKVGDTVYKICPISPFLEVGDLWSGQIIKGDCDRCPYGTCDCHDVGPNFDGNHKNVVHEMTVTSLAALVRIIPYFGSIYFLTREEAEAALKGGAE